MKLDYIEIYEVKHRPLMNGITVRFPSNANGYISTNCFIGINGSGKSQLLETLAEIFLHLDMVFRKQNRVNVAFVPVLYKIKYTIIIIDKKYQVEIDLKSYKEKKPTLLVLDENNEEIAIDKDDFEKFLPSRIIGYTSGQNETISTPFLSYYDDYANFVTGLALGGKKEMDYKPRFYFMDYSTNLGIAISNLVFDNDLFNRNDNDGLTKIKKELKIQNLDSFQIVIQTKQSAAPKIKSKSGETGVLLTEDLKTWLSYLKKSATCYNYTEKDNKYIFDFLLDSASKEALIHFFKTPYILYTALYKFELLNNLIVDKRTRKNIEKLRKARKLTAKLPEVPDKDKVLRYSELKLTLTNGEVVNYLSLSDGEHQFINVFGTILMIVDQNSLFLMDEPETHFNPKWRRRFISNLNDVTKGRFQDLFLTSHSPFIVSDMGKEFVYIFKRIHKNKIEVQFPKLETYGASFNHILKMAFELEDTISQDSSQFIDELYKSNDPKEIEQGLNKLGDSPKIMTLYRRIDMLENKK